MRNQAITMDTLAQVVVRVRCLMGVMVAWVVFVVTTAAVDSNVVTAAAW
jgi:uncharacterized membrane protein